MIALTPEQVARARREKSRYMISILMILCVLGLMILGGRAGAVPAVVFWWIRRVVILWLAISTWRLCRAIGLGIIWTAIATALSPFLGLFESVVLLRVYASRTGVKLTLLGEKDPEKAAA